MQTSGSSSSTHFLASFGLILAGISLFFSCVPASAENFTITPGILERATWNDNFFLKGFDDIELRSEPSITGAYETERTNALLTARLYDYRYADIDQYDRTTYQVQTRLGYKFTERFEAGVSGSWSQDYSLDSYWDDYLNEKDMLRRDSYNAAVNASYQLTERDSLQFTFGWATMEYEKRIVNYSDYDMLNASVVWQHLLNDGTMALVAQGSWQRVEFDTAPRDGMIWGMFRNYFKQDITQEVYSGTAGFYWMISERLTLQAMAGLNYTDSEIKNESESPFSSPSRQSSKTSTSETGFTGSVDLVWREENKSASLKIGQEFLPSTRGELRRVTSVRLSGSYQYTPKASFYSGASYNHTTSDEISYGNKIDRDFWIFSLNHRYRFTEDFSTTLQYNYIYYDNKAGNKTENSNSVFLQFAYALPLHF